MWLIRQRSTPSRERLLLRSVVHEIGPPLATLSSLVRAIDTQTNPDRRAEMTALAAEYATHAQAVLREAKELASGTPTPAAEAAPLGRVLPAVTAALAGERLSVEVSPVAAGWPVHRQHTRQILTNLVDNAIRHSSGTVCVGALVGSSHLRLTVTDEGAPNAALARALRRFTAPRDDRGLGLWVVRRLVAAHGGRVRARRARPRGLVLEVLLPRYRP